MGLDLCFAAAKDTDDGEGQKLAGIQGKAFARIEVTEAGGGKTVDHNFLLSLQLIL